MFGSLARLVLGLLCAGFLSSCLSMQMVARAKGEPGPADPPTMAPGEPQPGYYALVPLVFPIDLLIWPFQLPYLQKKPEAQPLREPASLREPLDAPYRPPSYSRPVAN